MHYVGLIGTPHGRSIFEKYPTLCAVSMPKRKSPLPTLPKVEYVGEVALDLGGVHGYKKVKKLGPGFQGASPKSKTYTGIKKTAKEAALALGVKKFKEKHGREPRVPQDEATTLALPDFAPGEPIPTQSIPSIYSLSLLARLTAAQLTIAVPDDPRQMLPVSPKPLTPPGTVSDGFGNYRPRLAPIMRLEPQQADALLMHGGLSQAMANPMAIVS